MFEKIYSIFQIETDGEEFDSETDALIAANIALRDILRLRDWKFLEKSYTMPTGSLSFAGITTLDKILTVWYDKVELAKANREERFDEDKDYYIDYTNKLIVSVNETDPLTTSEMILDYKDKPADLTSATVASTIDGLEAAIAYKMVLDYYEKDQDLSVYTQAKNKFDAEIDSMINYDANL